MGCLLGVESAATSGRGVGWSGLGAIDSEGIDARTCRASWSRAEARRGMQCSGEGSVRRCDNVAPSWLTARRPTPRATAHLVLGRGTTAAASRVPASAAAHPNCCREGCEWRVPFFCSGAPTLTLPPPPVLGQTHARRGNMAGELYTWGWGKDGQLGHGDRQSEDSSAGRVL